MRRGLWTLWTLGALTIPLLGTNPVAAQAPETAPASAQSADSAAEHAAPPPLARIGLALVIGNSRYAQAELPSVALDRASMAKALQSQGFKVREVEDLQRPRDFQEELQTFLVAENATPEDILLVYYSGHGLQIEGKPYLLGTGIKVTGDVSASLREYSESVDDIIKKMEDAAPAARILIVDACRNNAFALASRKAGPAFQRGVEDTYILFADEPGKTVPARTETTLQSPFTAGLLFAFENSDEGLEKRFEIAVEKTRALNPDQSPQMLKSDPSTSRDRAFLDHAGRSAPTRSAGKMLNDAEDLYRTGSWAAFRDNVRAARVLSSEPALNARLDKEVQFANWVISAQTAEADEAGAKWADAASDWLKAGSLFGSRSWVLEKAALDWLLADRLQEAVSALAHLQNSSNQAAADRSAKMLANLIQAYPNLEAIKKSVIVDDAAPAGAEFEKYVAP
jgi:caspase domain-containing protein